MYLMMGWIEVISIASIYMDDLNPSLPDQACTKSPKMLPILNESEWKLGHSQLKKPKISTFLFFYILIRGMGWWVRPKKG